MNKFAIGGIITGVVLVVGLGVGSMFVEKVESGHVGVVYSTGGVEEQALGQGYHILGFFDKVNHYPIKMQTKNYESIAVATKDGKNISLDMAINFTVDSAKAVDLFNKFGAVTVDSIADGYLKTRLRDSARQVIAQYSVIDIYGEKSSEASLAIQTAFAKDVEELGFIVEGLTLGVPQADQKTQEAIDARITASQELERKKTELEIAEAEAERLRVEAEGIKEANRIISESLTDEILEQKAIEKWDGKLPMVTDGGNAFVNIPTDK